jgi:hypothetical protein
VEVIVQAYVYRFNVIAGQQVSEVGVNIGDVEKLRDAVGFDFGDVGYGHHLCPANFLVVVQMAFADLAYPNNANTDFSVCVAHG